MSEVFKQELETGVQVARLAGQIMRDYFNHDVQEREIKIDGTPLTIADTMINSMVITELAKSFPNDGVIGEEESTTGYGGGRKWFCDPIDGTRSYTWGVPTSMFSLALVIDGVPQVGVAYDPYMDKMYTGVKGEGSFCNDQPLHVSDKTLDGGIVAVTANPRKLQEAANYTSQISEAGADMAVYSSAVHKTTQVATGRFVAYIEKDVNPHDMAAVHVIIEEAGGRITDMQGNTYDYKKPFKGTLVSNGIVHDQLLDILSRESSAVKPSPAHLQ